MHYKHNQYQSKIDTDRHTLNYLIIGGMVGVTAVCGMVLAAVRTYADEVNDDVSVTVPLSCSLSGTIGTGDEHTATIPGGQYSAATGSEYADGIGKTVLSAFCNDLNGFSIYAIGYTGNMDGDNTLVGVSTDEIINTGVYSEGDTTSSWSMKVTKVENPATGDPVTYNPQNLTVDNSFGSWHAVPNDYARVAHYQAATGSSVTDTVLGAKLETTYAAYVARFQAADTYVGQVKYVMVNPYDSTDANAPVKFTWQASTATRPADADVKFMMQDFTVAMCSVGQPGQIGWVKDSRDNTVYTIGKLDDGKCWLLDNLALDLTDSTVLNGMNADNTNASNTTLGYLKGDTTRNPATDASGKYATSAVSDWSTNPTYGSGNSYSDPLVDTASRNLTNSSDSLSDNAKTWKYGVYYNYCAASAGSYCYGNGTSYGTSSGNATEDICPKNWRMPTSNTGGEYDTLYSNSNYNTAATYRSALRLPLSGYFDNGSVINQGGNGFFWSSTRSSNYIMYYLYVYASYVNPSGNGNRYNGFSVRCLLGS